MKCFHGHFDANVYAYNKHTTLCSQYNYTEFNVYKRRDRRRQYSGDNASVWFREGHDWKLRHIDENCLNLSSKSNYINIKTQGKNSKKPDLLQQNP